MSNKVLEEVEEGFAETSRQRLQRWLLSPQLRQHMQTATEGAEPPAKIGVWSKNSAEP